MYAASSCILPARCRCRAYLFPLRRYHVKSGADSAAIGLRHRFAAPDSDRRVVRRSPSQARVCRTRSG
eukprot:3322416-Rhodomonas_salina.1